MSKGLRYWMNGEPGIQTPRFCSPSSHRPALKGVRETHADHVDYLPFDRPLAMRKWAQALEVSDLILVKYELWPGLIRSQLDAGTRIHLVAARFDHDRHPMGWTGAWMRKHLKRLTTIQVQDRSLCHSSAFSGSDC